MLDGSKKLLNTMRDAIAHLTAHGLPTTYLALAVAAYIRYVTGIDVEGEEIPEVLDPMADELREPARMACRLRSLPPSPTRGVNGHAGNGNGTTVAAALELAAEDDGPLSDKVWGCCGVDGWMHGWIVGLTSIDWLLPAWPLLTADHFLHPLTSHTRYNKSHNLKPQEYDPREVVRLVFGKETAGNEAFVKNVAHYLRMICEKGMPYTLLHVD